MEVGDRLLDWHKTRTCVGHTWFLQYLRLETSYHNMTLNNTEKEPLLPASLGLDFSTLTL